MHQMLQGLFTAMVCVLLTGLPTAAQESAVVHRINPQTMPSSLDYGYSQVATVESGSRLVFVAGQVGYLPDGPNDFETQVDRSFENLRAGLEAAGADANDVVRITLLIKDHNPEKLAYLVQKRKAFFTTAAPTSVLIPVIRLYDNDVAFEISAIAALAPGKTEITKATN